MKKLMALMTLMTLTACDRLPRADVRAERDDRNYKAAMEDYQAGRLAAAVKGFEKVIAVDPANASARFQLACLLQDSLRDHLGAYCAFREYLLQRPDSDKAALAKDRMALCEKEVARMLAVRHGLNGSEGATAEIAALRKDLAASVARADASEKNLRESMVRIRALTAEKDRLLGVVNAIPDDAAANAGKPSVKEARDLLDEEEDESPAAVSREEVVQLRVESAEENQVASPLLPKRDPNQRPQTDAKKDEKPRSDRAVERPSSYVVKEGDTLYGIAKRFYGTVSAWKSIRDANKTLISTDSRLRAGDKIVLPRP